MTRALALLALLLCSQAHAGMCWANNQQATGLVVWFPSTTGGAVSGTAMQTVASGANCSAVTATPDSHYHFVNWTRNGSAYSTDNPLTVANVTASMTITANFAIDTYTVTFVEGANGTISGTKVQTVNYGASSNSVTAVPNSTYRFVNWTGDATSTSNPLTVSNVTTNMTITANFLKTYTVTFASGGNGTLSGDTSQTVDSGGNCSAVTPSPSYNYHFVNWTGDISSTANPLTVTNVTSDMAVTAHFSNTWSVVFAVDVSYHGYLTGDTTQTVINGGACDMVEASSYGGWLFDKWWNDTDNVEIDDYGAVDELTVTNVTKNLQITARFKSQ